MKELKTLLFGLLMITQCTFGQNQSTDNRIPFIEVTGYAEKLINPDEIYISIIIKDRESGRDNTSIEVQVVALKKTLQELNISIDNLTVSDAHADYIRIKWSKKDVVSQSEYELKVSTSKEAASVFSMLDELKIENARISRISHSKLITLQKELRIMAIKAAKDKADYLLEAIGQKTGTALVVKEQTINDFAHNIDGFNIRGALGESVVQYSPSKFKGEIQFKKIKLESNIYVKFEIAQ